MKIGDEEIRVKGGELKDKVKDLLHEGNVRRIIVRDGEGNTVMEIPVAAGVVVAVIAPILTALGAIAALASEWSIQIQRRQPDEDEAGESP
jgi:hypothetical protein